jgi:hypothetical protein
VGCQHSFEGLFSLKVSKCLPAGRLSSFQVALCFIELNLNVMVPNLLMHYSRMIS